MKKLLALMLVFMLLPCAALAERYTDVAAYYLNTYGEWWDYSQELWLEYAAATRASDVSGRGGSTAQAIAATEYILPPEGALSPEEAAAIAIGTDPDLKARPLVPCFMLDGRVMYKVILYLPGADSAFTRTVEMDAMTGEILGVYPYLTVEVGYLFVPNKVWVATSLDYPAEELAKMTWSQLADLYIARHGTWWDWNSVRWGEFVTAVRQADVSNSRTGLAVAATEYIRPSHEMLFEEEAKEIACDAFGADACADNLVLCFRVEGRAMFKVTVHKAQRVYSVEMDAYTGEILGIYPQTVDGVGQFFVPHALWEAMPMTAPNG